MGVDALASLPARTLARAIDGLIVFTVMLALGPANLERTDGELRVPAWVIVAVVASFIVYETAMVALRGRTVGKLYTRIRVASIIDGQRPTALQALLRALVVAAPLAALGTWGPFGAELVYLTAALDRTTGRGLPDRVAKTVVVQSSEEI